MSVKEFEANGFKFYGDVNVIKEKKSVIATFGNFDGVHVGHQLLLLQLRAASKGSPLLVLTFDPHPTAVLKPEHAKKPLMTIQGRVEHLLANGADVVAVRKFDVAFSQISADEFCKSCLEDLNVKLVMPGYCVTYGKNREGNFSHLEAQGKLRGFEVVQASTHVEDGFPVSSSRVRTAIEAGEVELASKMLGRSYFMDGIVGAGDKVARTLGYPTANLSAYVGVEPGPGVYFCEVSLGGESTRRPAVASCGFRPSTAEAGKYQIEAHIFDFDETIYGRKIRFYFRKFLRKEMKFESLEDLKIGIAKDADAAKKYFNL